MSLRNAFGAALQFLRANKRLSQREISTHIDPSHVSRLEAAQRSVSLEVSRELAQALNLDPMSLLALVYAADTGESPRTIIRRAYEDLESLALLDATLPGEPTKIEHPRIVGAAELKQKIMRLMAEGNSQADVARLLGIAKSTVTRRLQSKDDR